MGRTRKVCSYKIHKYYYLQGRVLTQIWRRRKDCHCSTSPARHALENWRGVHGSPSPFCWLAWHRISLHRIGLIRDTQTHTLQECETSHPKSIPVMNVSIWLRHLLLLQFTVTLWIGLNYKVWSWNVSLRIDSNGVVDMRNWIHTNQINIQMGMQNLC